MRFKRISCAFTAAALCVAVSSAAHAGEVVGYSNGTGAAGTYYGLPGSLQFGQFRDGDPRSPAAGSNVGVAGRYLFNVRSGQVTPGAPAVPEPATWATMILGFGFVGYGLRRRKVDFALA